ncbi:MAG: glycosyltransferase [Bacteroidetes bacterium]|nr:glycosyltransferase [Bacteroidota bacterium]
MNSQKLHVLYLPRWYPNRYDPMPGLFIRRHAEAVSSFCQVSVVYVHADDKRSRGYEVVETNEPGLTTFVIYFPKSFSRLLNLWRFLRANFLGIRLVRRKHGVPDLIHVHVLTRLALIAWWYKVRYGIPYLITEHWSRYIPSRNEFKGLVRKGLTRFLVRRASMLTTVTQNLARAMQAHKMTNQDVRILPNVVDTARFQPAARKRDFPRQIVHVSCFEDRSKNISGLLRALKSLRQQRTDFECVLIGEGMDFDAIKQQALSLDMLEYVRFTGLIEGQELAEQLAQGHFLVLFSNYENLPVVIPEALACGLPVVATDVGGISELINPSNGMLVPPGDEQKLVWAMDRMLNMLASFDAAELRNCVVETNSKEAVGRLLHEWYREIAR